MLSSVRRVSVALVAAAAIVQVAPAALAQKKGADDPKQKEARDHYEKGITHYNLGEFDEAITEFKQAYAISQAPGLLFNIAQSYRLKKDYAQALYFYKTYVRLQPDAPNKEQKQMGRR